jgi:glyoxylase-like metal-dependent hydrolase (beta-lactamase superfamily II)
MEKQLEKITERIYRLRVPFENLYTSVFFILTKDGVAVVDCATANTDVDGYILPALKSLGVDKNFIKYLILTHSHGDHVGGLERMGILFPRVEIVNGVLPLALDGITLCELKGHTLGCIGVFDKESGTLISGDGLQGEGIGKYRCSLESKDEYLKTVETLKRDTRIKRILFSHAYEPWQKDHATGEAEIEKCLSDCINCLQ